MRRKALTGTGTVKFYKADKGWGGIEGPDLLGDVWVHFSNIECDGYKTLEAGQRVEVTYEPGNQDSWQYVAISVRPIGGG